MIDVRDPLVGQLVLGRYRIVQLLARGGMAAVFLARVEGAAGFSKPVVVKCILPHLSGSSEDESQFILEARILSHLRHPGIVNVIDFGRLDESHLMVLEYIHGYHLGQWLKYVTHTRGQLPWQACVWVMLQVLSALQYAHTYTRSDGSRSAIIHRDISPANILIDLEGTVRLADFGIARIDAEQTSKNVAQVKVFRGKFPYAAPELFSGGKATTLTDVYACGVVLYQLLAGTNPFTAEDPAAIVRRVLTVFPNPISHARPDVPTEMDLVLGRVLSKEPEDRYPTAKELAAALRALLPRSEADVGSEVAAMIRADFTGDLPRVLQRESLESLEAAWRKVGSQSKIPIQSSAPPTIQVGPMALPHEDAPTPAASSSRQSAHPAQSASHSRLALTVTLVATLCAGIAVTAVLLTRAALPSAQPQFLVVESHADADSISNATPKSVTSMAAPSVQTPHPETSAESKTSRPSARQRDPLAALTQTFSRRQAAIQRCFTTHATDVSGAPEVSIRFSVDPRGQVIAASIRPAPIATTALGGCLERVARDTDFGPQERILDFSIPITARSH